MDWQQVFVLLLTGAAFVCFVRDTFAIELVALIAAALLLATGVLSPKELLGCFSNSAPVTIGALFVLTAALEHTGQIAKLGEVFNRLAAGSERRALALILVGCVFLSAVINNTPLVVVLMPVVLGFCRQTGSKASHLLIPLSFATILGGTCSMAGTSTNILADGILRKQGLDGLSLFSIAPLGLIYAAVGGTYLWFFSKKLLPVRPQPVSAELPSRGRDFLLQVAVQPGSPLIGQAVANLLNRKAGSPRVLEIRRRGQVLTESLGTLLLQESDRILIRTGAKGAHALKAADGVSFATSEAGLETLERRDSFLLEGLVSDQSPFIGRTVRELAIRQKFASLVLAIHREGENVRSNVEAVPLEAGDILLVEGTSEGVERLKSTKGFIQLSEQIEPEQPERGPNRGWFAIGGIALFIFLSSFNFSWIGLPHLQLDTFAAAFLAAVFVLVTGCLRPAEAYEAIDWRIIFLIIGMLALGTAMETTGAAATLAGSILAVLSPFGPFWILCGIYLLTTILTELISNNAVAVILVPIAINIGHGLDVSPLPFVIAVMFAASASFSTPIGYQTNTYVFAAGGYKFSDFVRIGVPLNVLLWITASLVIPLLWPF